LFINPPEVEPHTGKMMKKVLFIIKNLALFPFKMVLGLFLCLLRIIKLTLFVAVFLFIVLAVWALAALNIIFSLKF